MRKLPRRLRKAMKLAAHWRKVKTLRRQPRQGRGQIASAYNVAGKFRPFGIDTVEEEDVCE